MLSVFRVEKQENYALERGVRCLCSERHVYPKDGKTLSHANKVVLLRTVICNYATMNLIKQMSKLNKMLHISYGLYTERFAEAEECVRTSI